MEVDWSDLSEDVLFSIAKRTEHLSDYIGFGAVCKSWRSAITVNPRPLHLRFPFILLFRDNNHALYSPLERKLHPIRLPDRSSRERCIGSSSDGWVCMIDDNLHLYLLNPFSGAVVLLPPLSTDFITNGSFEHVLKAAFSAEPSIIVILLCKKEEREMVYSCSPGNVRWKVLKTSLGFLHDAVLFKKGVYVMNWEGRRVRDDDKFKYLAAGPSGLLMVVRHMKNVYETRRFELFELDGTMEKWVETKSLDDGMLFLGMNTAIWLSSSGLKECKGNSIYFMDHNSDGLVEDLGIFYLEDGSFGSICGLDEKPLYDSFEWVVPIP